MKNVTQYFYDMSFSIFTGALNIKGEYLVYLILNI